jgi:DNA-binding PadR family transcriptional regulator
MKIEKAIKMLEILKYIHVNSECKAPQIRDYLGILHKNPPEKDEKDLYAQLNNMSKDGYIEKVPITRLGPGGAKFVFKIMELGSKQLARLRDYKLLTRGVSFSELDEKAKEVSLERMLRVFSSESFDMVLDLLEYLLKGQFADANIDIQKDAVDRINSVVFKIRNKTSEIAESFF